MIALDVRGYGKKVTLEKCAALYEDMVQIMTPVPVKLGVKGRVIVLPDEIWITDWQYENVFRGVFGHWQLWRGIPIVVKDIK